MKAKTRRKLEMGARVLLFSRIHPEASPGSPMALARLEGRLRQASAAAEKERDGLTDSRIAAARKRDLVRTIRQAHLVHIREIARVAEAELPGFHKIFRLPRGTIPYQSFRTRVGFMLDEALSQKEVLLRYGLSEAVLDGLAEALKDFDRSAALGTSGELAHVGACVELDTIGHEIRHIVRAMDGCSRILFVHQPGLWASWQTASNVAAAPRPAISGTNDDEVARTGDLHPGA